MSINYSPLEDRVIIRPIKVSGLEKTEGGLIVPLSAKKEVSEGIVIAAGQGRYAPETGVAIPSFLSKGDKVLYGTSQGMEIEIETEDGKETVRLMREGDCLLLISEK